MTVVKITEVCFSVTVVNYCKNLFSRSIILYQVKDFISKSSSPAKRSHRSASSERSWVANPFLVLRGTQTIRSVVQNGNRSAYGIQNVKICYTYRVQGSSSWAWKASSSARMTRMTRATLTRLVLRKI